MPWSKRPTNDPNDDTTQVKDAVKIVSNNASSIIENTNTLVLCSVTSITTLALAAAYRKYLRRIPSIEYFKPHTLGGRSLYGYVASVGDGDGLRLYHTPGGRLMGWGWLPWRKVQELTTKQLKDQTLSVRIAGVDAPEMAHFGKTAQPYAKEALEWLRSFVLHRYVRAYPYRKDQYDRIVCIVSRRRWFFFRSDVGLQMLKRGLATVYEAKFGSVFGTKERQYRNAEATAKSKKIGMWQEPGIIGKMLGKQSTVVETPRQYKNRTKTIEKES